jgi:hypothetical protein
LDRRELRRHEPAERVAGEIDLLQPRGVEPAAEPRAQLLGPQRGSETGQIDDVHTAPGGQSPQQRRPPPPRSGQAVDEHERLAAPSDPVSNRSAADLDLALLYLSFTNVVHLIRSGRCLRRRIRRQFSTRR